MLKRATWRDCLWVWRLRNDPDAVRWSRTGRVPLWRHLWWWWTRDPESTWIIGANVGYIRIGPDRSVSIAILPACRGRGVGFWALAGAVATFSRDGPLHATIHMDNEASRALFFKAGFVCLTADGPWYRYEYRPRPPR
jgi:GNAT superfamily N-acetyltransferase